MAANTLIPVSEYLTTVYRPDCDYVDGEVQERNLGEYDHGNLQLAIAAILRAKRKEWNIRVIPELRVQVTTNRFRIPDICVMSGDAPREQIIRHPPLLCIEVLSPEDRVSRMWERVRDFIKMGVPQVWIFDPQTRMALICNGETIVEQQSGVLALSGTPIVLDLEEVFSAIDE